MQDIPYGHCHCGCGEKTPIAKQTFTDRGWIQGEPIRFIHGHNARGQTKLDPLATEKRCPQCDTIRPLTEFGLRKRNPDGRNSWCKPCARAYAAAYHQQTKERRTDRQKAYESRNPDIRRTVKRNRLARERASLGRVTTKEWNAALDTYGRRCLACGATEHLEMDHVLPIAHGGTHTIDNVQPLCRTCNRKKAMRHVDYRPTPPGSS